MIVAFFSATYTGSGHAARLAYRDHVVELCDCRMRRTRTSCPGHISERLWQSRVRRCWEMDAAAKSPPVEAWTFNARSWMSTNVNALEIDASWELLASLILGLPRSQARIRWDLGLSPRPLHLLRADEGTRMLPRDTTLALHDRYRDISVQQDSARRPSCPNTWLTTNVCQHSSPAFSNWIFDRVRPDEVAMLLVLLKAGGLATLLYTS